MDQKKHDKDWERIDRRNMIEGSIHLSLFAILIILGIVAKRLYGKDALTVIMFHLPAAVFLIVGSMKITSKNRRRFSNQTVSQDER